MPTPSRPSRNFFRSSTGTSSPLGHILLKRPHGEAASFSTAALNAAAMAARASPARRLRAPCRASICFLHRGSHDPSLALSLDSSLRSSARGADVELATCPDIFASRCCTPTREASAASTSFSDCSRAASASSGPLPLLLAASSAATAAFSTSAATDSTASVASCVIAAASALAAASFTAVSSPDASARALASLSASALSRAAASACARAAS
mmetsp:Transcript_3125/g.8809  ORF Transcript_3125/g.8809 Transcript_3125/m.8809 type:complete len:212 (+) Transcript_3125:782-1417(+)